LLQRKAKEEEKRELKNKERKTWKRTRVNEEKERRLGVNRPKQQKKSQTARGIFGKPVKERRK
jgi:hypothetical protein